MNFFIILLYLVSNFSLFACQNTKVHQIPMLNAINDIRHQLQKECQHVLLSCDSKLVLFICQNRFYIYTWDAAQEQLEQCQRICFYDCDERLCRPGGHDIIRSIKIEKQHDCIIGKFSHEYSVSTLMQSDDYLFVYQISSKSYCLIALPEDSNVYYKGVKNKVVIVGNKDTEWYFDCGEQRTYLTLQELKSSPVTPDTIDDLRIEIYHDPFTSIIKKILL